LRRCVTNTPGVVAGILRVESALHQGLWLEDADEDDHDAVWAVDSFTLVPTAGLALVIPSDRSIPRALPS
jgi:hypothetical protein